MLAVREPAQTLLFANDHELKTLVTILQTISLAILM